MMYQAVVKGTWADARSACQVNNIGAPRLLTEIKGHTHIVVDMAYVGSGELHKWFNATLTSSGPFPAGTLLWFGPYPEYEG